MSLEYLCFQLCECRVPNSCSYCVLDLSPSRSKGVCSYNLKMKDRVMVDVTTGDVVTVVPLPGCLLLQTVDGLNLVHPGL